MNLHSQGKINQNGKRIAAANGKNLGGKIGQYKKPIAKHLTRKKYYKKQYERNTINNSDTNVEKTNSEKVPKNVPIRTPKLSYEKLCCLIVNVFKKCF